MNAVALASIYQVDPTQVRRWVRRGLHPESPDLLFIELGRQHRPGRTFRNLYNDQFRENIKAKIHEHTTRIDTKATP